jgi:hypothetical protein
MEQNMGEPFFSLVGSDQTANKVQGGDSIATARNGSHRTGFFVFGFYPLSLE